MFVHIDYSSSEPISHQVVAQVKRLVVGGQLKSGDRLPSIRELARQLKVNPTTITRIYGELEHSGVITLRQGRGAFVSQPAQLLPPQEVRRLVGRHAQAMLVEGLRLGLEKEQIEQIVNEEYAKIRIPENE